MTMPQFRLILLAIALVVGYVASQAQTTYLPEATNTTDTANLEEIATALTAAAVGDTAVTKLSAGAADDDEFAICTGPCTLTSVVCENFSEDTDYYFKLVNATMAGTTPGTTALWHSPILIPFGPGARQLPPLFLGASVALTGYYSALPGATDHTDVPSGEVSCTVGKR